MCISFFSFLYQLYIRGVDENTLRIFEEIGWKFFFRRGRRDAGLKNTHIAGGTKHRLFEYVSNSSRIFMMSTHLAIFPFSFNLKTLTISIPNLELTRLNFFFNCISTAFYMWNVPVFFIHVY